MTSKLISGDLNDLCTHSKILWHVSRKSRSHLIHLGSCKNVSLSHGDHVRVGLHLERALRAAEVGRRRRRLHHVRVHRAAHFHIYVSRVTSLRGPIQNLHVSYLNTTETGYVQSCNLSRTKKWLYAQIWLQRPKSALEGLYLTLYPNSTVPRKFGFTKKIPQNLFHDETPEN